MTQMHFTFPLLQHWLGGISWQRSRDLAFHFLDSSPFTARVVAPTRMFGSSAKLSFHKSGGLIICRIWMPLSNATVV